ncbi:heavy-metal-associated domain-containing protein [bacterium]|nr:heavy-metal-associated domain-containing protein [bacterium]
MEIELKIEGMTCQHCQRAVLQALQQVAGVASVEVDLEQKKARVTGIASLDHLRQAVEEEGYSVAAE